MKHSFEIYADKAKSSPYIKDPMQIEVYEAKNAAAKLLGLDSTKRLGAVRRVKHPSIDGHYLLQIEFGIGKMSSISNYDDAFDDVRIIYIDHLPDPDGIISLTYEETVPFVLGDMVLYVGNDNGFFVTIVDGIITSIPANATLKEGNLPFREEWNEYH